MKIRSPRQKLTLRAIVVLCVLVVFGFGTSVASLARIQIKQADEYRSKAERNQLLDTKVPARRGTIYDANGKILAQSAAVWKVYINPKGLSSDAMLDAVAENLSEILGVDKQEVLDKGKDRTRQYVLIQSGVEYEQKEAVAALRSTPFEENGKKTYYRMVVGIEDDVKRYYPYGNFACAVLGFTGIDGDGRAGIEMYYDTALAGTPGRILTARNGNNDVMPMYHQTVYEPKQGANLVLTIDEVIQRYLEKGLAQVYEESGGKGAYGIVMNVNTGAVLAMAGLPNYDLNKPYTVTDKNLLARIETAAEDEKNAELRKAQFAQWRNFTVSDTYEPGSVFKIVPASAAVEEKAWSMTETYTCHGSITVRDRTMACHRREGHGTQTISQALVNSCNPYFITVGQRLGVDMFFRYFEGFGLTERTGIDLPAEAASVPGVTYHAKDSMSIVELSSSSFGQSFQVSPIQMITATAAIANGGKLMRPYVVAKTLDEDGNTLSVTEPYVRRRVISESTASTITDMMEQVVLNGSGRNSYVAGYRVAGKTGTSEKLKQGQDEEKKAYIASFVCFAPADDARIAVLIMIDEPVDQIGGGQIAAPIAGQVVENTLEYLNVEPRYTQREIEQLNTNPPNLIGNTSTAAEDKLQSLGFSSIVLGGGDKVIAQSPAFSQSLPKNGIVVLYTDEASIGKKTEVPDLTGLTITQANKRAATAGLNIKIAGNALIGTELISYAQSIQAQSEMEYGSVITVHFKSAAVAAEAG